MISKNISIFLIITMSVIISAQGVAQKDVSPDWKLSKDKNGIRIYTRSVEGMKYKEYKSTINIEATPEEFIDILLDIDSYTKWMAHVKHASLLEMDGENKFYVYSEVNIPWPFDNRDEITLSEVIRYPDSDVVEIAITIIPDYLPENKGIVRMPSGRGQWIFTPLENGSTEVYHRFGGDPGGKIPAWIVNMFLVDGPYKTLMNLKELVDKKKE